MTTLHDTYHKIVVAGKEYCIRIRCPNNENDLRKAVLKQIRVNDETGKADGIHDLHLDIVLWPGVSDLVNNDIFCTDTLFPRYPSRPVVGEVSHTRPVAVPLLSLTFLPLSFLHEQVEQKASLCIDHRIGILDHSIWHRCLTMPEEIERLEPVVKAMLQDWRLRTLVAHEGRNMLRGRFESFDRPGIKLPSGHADTYRVSFPPSSVIRKDIDQLREFFDDSTPNDGESKTKRPLVMIDDHKDKLRLFANPATTQKPGKKEAIWQAMLECASGLWEQVSYAEDWSWPSIRQSANLPFSRDAWDWQEYDHFRSFAKKLWESSAEKDSEKEKDSKEALGEPVILLDFLFSDKGGEERLGTTLIKELIAPPDKEKKCENERLQRIIDQGPFAVFFISSFTWGVWEELNKGSFPLHSGSLFVDLGQDPVCFPEMFVKKFLQFLVSRETRPLVNALETLEKAEDGLLGSLCESKDKDTGVRAQSLAIYPWTGIMAAYTKYASNLMEQSLLANDTPVMKLVKRVTSSPIVDIHECLGRYLFAGPEDCRVIYSKFRENWQSNALNEKHCVNSNSQLPRKLEALREEIYKDLKKLMEFY